MSERTRKQCCTSADATVSTNSSDRVGRKAVAALAAMLTLPAGWVAAQGPEDVGGKAPVGEEVLEPDAAVTDKAEKGWLAGDTATGDWGGLRTKLAEQGITFEGGLVADFLALARGGASGGGNWDYAGYTYLGVTFDLETLAHLPGLSFYVESGWSFGEDIGRKTGSIFSPAEAFTGRAVRLSRMYLQQDLLEDRLSLKIGRLATEDDFLSSPIYGQYVSAAINSVPGSILESTPGFSTFPGVQWGAVAAYKPHEQVRTAFGVYGSDEDINKDKEHGIDFSFNPNNGVMAIGEVDYLWKLGGEEAASLPGEVKVGGWYDTGPRPEASRRNLQRRRQRRFLCWSAADGVSRRRRRKHAGINSLGCGDLRAPTVHQRGPILFRRRYGVRRPDPNSRRRSGSHWLLLGCVEPEHRRHQFGEDTGTRVHGAAHTLVPRAADCAIYLPAGRHQRELRCRGPGRRNRHHLLNSNGLRTLADQRA